MLLAATEGRALADGGWIFAYDGGSRAVTEYRTPGRRLEGPPETARAFEFLRDRIAEGVATGRPLWVCVREACAMLLETYDGGAFDFFLARGPLLFAHVHLEPLALDGSVLAPLGAGVRSGLPIFARRPEFLGRLILWCGGAIVVDEHY